MRKIHPSRYLALIILVLSSLLTACGDTPSQSFTPVSSTFVPTTAVPTTTAASNPSNPPPASTTTAPATTAPTASTGKAMVGLNIYLYGQDDKVVSQTLDWLKDLQVKWVRLPLYWNEIETAKGQYNWEQVDKAIDTLHQAGINIMLNAIHCPAWAAITPERPGLPRDMNDFANFVKLAATRYKGKVAAYEIWNEPNLEREAGKPVKADGFVALLKAGYIGVKSVDPAAIIVTGGLTPTGNNDPNFAVDDVEYLKQFYAYNNGEAKKYYDVLGAHPGSTLNPPDTLWPDKPGPGPGWLDHPSFYFRRIEQIRKVMLDNGESAKKVWFTEFGWASTPNPASGFGFAKQVSDEQQGQYLARALDKGRNEYDWVGQMFIFQLNMALPSLTPDPTDERIAWGLVRRDGSKRPSYLAIQNFIKANR